MLFCSMIVLCLQDKMELCQQQPDMRKRRVISILAVTGSRIIQVKIIMLPYCELACQYRDLFTDQLYFFQDEMIVQNAAFLCV